MTTLNGLTIGQAERATRAVLDALLESLDTTFPRWIVVNVVATTEAPVSRDAVAARLMQGLRTPRSAADEVVDAAAGDGLVRIASDRVELTADGHALYQRVGVGLAAITDELYGDVPTADLETAGRVLELVTERANAALART